MIEDKSLQACNIESWEVLDKTMRQEQLDYNLMKKAENRQACNHYIPFLPLSYNHREVDLISLERHNRKQQYRQILF
jgi:hypothetical protein